MVILSLFSNSIEHNLYFVYDGPFWSEIDEKAWLCCDWQVIDTALSHLAVTDISCIFTVSFQMIEVIAWFSFPEKWLFSLKLYLESLVVAKKYMLQQPETTITKISYKTNPESKRQKALKSSTHTNGGRHREQVHLSAYALSECVNVFLNRFLKRY